MFRSIVTVAMLVVGAASAHAQVRGLYPPGMSATNSGVMAEPGLTYQSIFQLYTFDSLQGSSGESLPVDARASVMIYQNLFAYVSERKVLGGHYAVMADLPGTNNAIDAVRFGSLAGGGGLADTFYSPLTLGWHLTRADLQTGYSFFAPTGRFHAGANDNTGAGYWANFLTAGQTVYLTKNKATAVSAYQVYEFHGTQKETDIRPGQTFDIDYSVTQMLPLQKGEETLLQVGMVGYGQYQTTDRSGPGVNSAIAANTRYRVNALGATANIVLPKRKAGLGVKYFNELAVTSSVQGQSVQINGWITF